MWWIKTVTPASYIHKIGPVVDPFGHRGSSLDEEVSHSQEPTHLIRRRRSTTRGARHDAPRRMTPHNRNYDEDTLCGEVVVRGFVVCSS
jgi:hypothetical protein